ncbi:MAG: response regulator transcription factor [Candidatus Omnitrophota bacterium]|nr:response regulator transcription factor [Candidatus Omnitrophota bacterium]
MKERILIVEDEPSILTGLVDLLSSEGFTVYSARNGLEAISLYEQQRPSLILLDIMIPEKSGYEVCKEIRKKDSLTPILMLTAKGQEIDKVVGLEVGADDYIVKPFGVKELLARVRAALRRAAAKPQKRDDTPIVFGDIYINPKTLKGRKGKKEFPVSLREIQLLQLFLKRKGEVIDRFDILNEVWGIKYEGTTRTLDQHIVKLRQKIEDNPSHPKYIITVHSVGYQFFPKPRSK